jgi:hypothetical protein
MRIPRSRRGYGNIDFVNQVSQFPAKDSEKVTHHFLPTQGAALSFLSSKRGEDLIDLAVQIGTAPTERFHLRDKIDV